MSSAVFRASLGLRRRVLLLTYTIILLVVISATIIFVVVILSNQHVVLADRTAETGDVVAGSTLLLAFIAALIALQAYAAATGLPTLKIQLWFNYSDKNVPVFRASLGDDGLLETGTPRDQTIATVLVSNSSGYSGRNPAIVMRLNAMLCEAPDPAAAWFTIESAENGSARAVQWDGGASYSIHGHSVRRLPALDLGRLRYIPESGDPSITVEMLAEGGYRREILVPVEFIVEGRPALSTAETRSDWAKEWL